MRNEGIEVDMKGFLIYHVTPDNQFSKQFCDFMSGSSLQ